MRYVGRFKVSNDMGDWSHIPKVRVFDGKDYILHGTVTTERKKDAVLDTLRKKGYVARPVVYRREGKSIYAIFIRKKGAKIDVVKDGDGFAIREGGVKVGYAPNRKEAQLEAMKLRSKKK